MNYVVLVTTLILSTTHAYSKGAEPPPESGLHQCSYYTEDSSDDSVTFFRSDWLSSRLEAKSQAKQRCEQSIEDDWLATCTFHSCQTSE